MPGPSAGFGASEALTVPPIRSAHAVSTPSRARGGRGEGVLWRAERQTVVRIERPALSDRMGGVLRKRRHPDDPDGRPAVVLAATPRDSGPMRLNLPVSSPVLLVCHDDAGWCAGAGTFEHSPASLVLT